MATMHGPDGHGEHRAAILLVALATGLLGAGLLVSVRSHATVSPGASVGIPAPVLEARPEAHALEGHEPYWYQLLGAAAATTALEPRALEGHELYWYDRVRQAAAAQQSQDRAREDHKGVLVYRAHRR